MSSGMVPIVLYFAWKAIVAEKIKVIQGQIFYQFLLAENKSSVVFSANLDEKVNGYNCLAAMLITMRWQVAYHMSPLCTDDEAHNYTGCGLKFFPSQNSYIKT